MAKYPIKDLFDDYEVDHVLDAVPAVHVYDRSYYLAKGQTLDRNKE
jgi:hypothetical protein